MHQRHDTSKVNSYQKLTQELLLEDDEAVKFVVKKHPFGIFIIVFGVIIALLLVAVTGALAGITFNNTSSQLTKIAVFVLAILISIILSFAVYIYFESRFVITDKHIVQILQIGLFNRKTSQLSLLNLEDVTVDKKGIFATILNFGTLTIETAGEQKNFIYTYCPNPNFYADAVLDARRDFIKKQNINPTSTTVLAS